MRIELNCAECGNNRFTLDEAKSDTCLIHCAECGHKIGTFGQLKEQIAEEVIARATRNAA